MLFRLRESILSGGGNRDAIVNPLERPPKCPGDWFLVVDDEHGMRHDVALREARQ
jgi:hypothetical protein